MRVSYSHDDKYTRQSLSAVKVVNKLIIKMFAQIGSMSSEKRDFFYQTLNFQRLRYLNLSQRAFHYGSIFSKIIRICDIQPAGC